MIPCEPLTSERKNPMENILPATVLAAALMLTGCSAPAATPASSGAPTPIATPWAAGALSGERVIPATNTVKAGDALKVTGAGWAPGVVIKLSGQKTPPRAADGTIGSTYDPTATGPLGEDVTVTVGTDGRYEGTFKIPGDAAPQSFLVVATGNDGMNGGALITVG